METRTISGLLIEDDADDTLLLMALMAEPAWPSFKFAFTCAETLETGLGLLEAGGIEVILLDLNLPDSRGLETVQRVRAKAPDIPIVVLTGLSDETLGLQALAAGAEDFQVKGKTDAPALKRCISYAVQRHRLLTDLKSMIDGAPDGAVIVDERGTVRYLNPAARDLFRGDGRLSEGQPFPHPLPRARSAELKVKGPDGSERTVEVRVTGIDWRGEAARLASLRDITELRRAAQLTAEIIERRRLDGLKDELMSAVTHEMALPLSIIRVAVGNLREGIAGPLSRRQDELVALQQRNISRLQRIFERVLDLARFESGRARVHPVPLDPGRAVGELLEDFRLLAGERKLAIEGDYLPGLPPVLADPELLHQVLSNLAENALRFASRRVLVRAQASSQPPGVVFSVIDDGRGIPPESLGAVFDKFYQVSRITKGTGYRGTGLGLALCKEMVERQGGRIWAESAPGRGARFHFILPLHRPAPAGAKAA